MRQDEENLQLQNNQTMAAARSMGEKINLARLQEAVHKLGLKGTVTEIPQQRPLWTAPRSGLIPLTEKNLKPENRGSQFEYTQDPASVPPGKVPGKATLSTTHSPPQIYLDPSNPQNIHAAVELVRAVGGKGVLVPDNFPPEALKELKSCCEKNNLTCDTYPVPKPAPATKKADDEENIASQANRTTLTPQLRR